VEYVENISTPAFFIAGKRDTLVAAHHVELLHKKYKGPKTLRLLDTGHNDPRPKPLLSEVVKFIRRCFKAKKAKEPE